MNKAAKITILSLACTLAFIAGVVLGRMIQPADRLPNGERIVEVTEISPEQFETVGQGMKVEEKTRAFSIFPFNSRSACETIASTGELEVNDTRFGEFKGIKSFARGPMIVVGLGAIAVLAGVAVFIWIDKKSGLIVAAAGGAMIAVGVMLEQYPWVTLAIPIIGIGVAAWYIFGTKAGRDLRERFNLVSTEKDEAEDQIRQIVVGGQKFKATLKDGQLGFTTEQIKAVVDAFNLSQQAAQDSATQQKVDSVKAAV